MTAYTTLSDADLTAGKPGTQAKFRALRDNAIAIAEGSSGAPRVYGASMPVLSFQDITTFSTNVDITGIDGTFHKYVVEIIELITDTDDVNLSFQCSTNGGSSYDSSAIYQHGATGSYATAGAGVSQSGGTAQGQIVITHAVAGLLLGSAANEEYNGKIYINKPNSAAYKKFGFDFEYSNTSGVMVFGKGGGEYGSTTAINAIRFSLSAGGKMKGKFLLRGIRHTLAGL